MSLGGCLVAAIVVSNTKVKVPSRTTPPAFGPDKNLANVPLGESESSGDEDESPRSSPPAAPADDSNATKSIPVGPIEPTVSINIRPSPPSPRQVVQGLTKSQQRRRSETSETGQDMIEKATKRLDVDKQSVWRRFEVMETVVPPVQLAFDDRDLYVGQIIRGQLSEEYPGMVETNMHLCLGGVAAGRDIQFYVPQSLGQMPVLKDLGTIAVPIDASKRSRDDANEQRYNSSGQHFGLFECCNSGIGLCLQGHFCCCMIAGAVHEWVDAHESVTYMGKSVEKDSAGARCWGWCPGCCGHFTLRNAANRALEFQPSFIEDCLISVFLCAVQSDSVATRDWDQKQESIRT